MRTVNRLQPRFPSADRRGVTLLVSVIIVGAITTTIAVSLLLTSVGVTKDSATALSTHQAQALTEACVNAALLNIHDNQQFSGSIPLTLSTGSCTATVVIGDGSRRIITASSTIGSVTKKMRVTLDQLSPKLNIARWEDVADF